MRGVGDSLSVLVVDEEPDVLSFFARILDANGMRALLARNADEAIDIAKRGYVPIDLVLADVFLHPNTVQSALNIGTELVDKLRQLRPSLRALYMSASVDSEVIRIELLDRGFQSMTKSTDERGLIEWIRDAAAGQLAQAMGGSTRQ